MRLIGRSLAIVVILAGPRASAPTADVDVPVFDVRDYGAQGNGRAHDGKAIQAALDACAKAGSGTVTLPPGRYLSGSLRLGSGVTLEIQKDATLLASTNPKDYEGRSRGQLLVADDASHVTLVGPGVIDGQVTADYGSRWGVSEKPAFRTGLILFTKSRWVTIRGLTLRHCDAWTVHLKRCEDVTIEGVKIRNNYRRLNSDGIDPNSCKRVRISSCDIVAGDDCIVLKTTEPFPCEDVIVKDCVLESAATALKLGTESYGDFRDIRFERCTIRHSPTGIGLYLKDGGTMERVVFKDIRIETTTDVQRPVTPLFIDIEKRHDDSKVGRIREITFEGLDIRTSTGALIQGMAASPIEKLVLRDVRVRVDRADDYAERKKPVGGNRTTRDERDTCYARLPSYFTVAHVQDLVVENLWVHIAEDAFREFDRSAFCGRSISRGVVRGVGRNPGQEAGLRRAVDLEGCEGVSVGETAP